MGTWPNYMYVFFHIYSLFCSHTVADIFMCIKVYRGIRTLVQIYMLGIHWFVNSFQFWYHRDALVRLWIGICFLIEGCVVGESYVIEASLTGTLSCDGTVLWDSLGNKVYSIVCVKMLNSNQWLMFVLVLTYCVIFIE